MGLMAVNRELVAQAETHDDSERVVLDMDSTESPVHVPARGQRLQRPCSSRSATTRWRRSTSMATCLSAKLRPGNVHRAEDSNELLLPEIKRQQAVGKQVTFRGDAAFAKPEIYVFFGGTRSAVRHSPSGQQELGIGDRRHLRSRPPGTPRRKPLVLYKSFRYQAESWSKPRRIVAIGRASSRCPVPAGRFYRDQHELVKPVGDTLLRTAEQWIKEGKQATHWTRLSCHRPRANEVRMQLDVRVWPTTWSTRGCGFGLPEQDQEFFIHELAAAV